VSTPGLTFHLIKWN